MSNIEEEAVVEASNSQEVRQVWFYSKTRGKAFLCQLYSWIPDRIFFSSSCFDVVIPGDEIENIEIWKLVRLFPIHI